MLSQLWLLIVAHISFKVCSRSTLLLLNNFKRQPWPRNVFTGRNLRPSLWLKWRYIVLIFFLFYLHRSAKIVFADFMFKNSWIFNYFGLPFHCFSALLSQADKAGSCLFMHFCSARFDWRAFFSLLTTTRLLGQQIVCNTSTHRPFGLTDKQVSSLNWTQYFVFILWN